MGSSRRADVIFCFGTDSNLLRVRVTARFKMAAPSGKAAHTLMRSGRGIHANLLVRGMTDRAWATENKKAFKSQPTKGGRKCTVKKRCPLYYVVDIITTRISTLFHGSRCDSFGRHRSDTVCNGHSFRRRDVTEKRPLFYDFRLQCTVTLARSPVIRLILRAPPRGEMYQADSFGRRKLPNDYPAYTQ